MKVIRKLLPGQPGTKKLVEKFGTDLICVRYRYDIKRKRKVKTVEIIINETSWNGEIKKTHPNKLVQLRVDYDEIDLRRKVKSSGGKWDKEKKVWILPYKEVVKLGLVARIIDGKN